MNKEKYLTENLYGYIYMVIYIYKYRRIISHFKNKECSIQVTISEHLLIINDLIQFFN